MQGPRLTRALDHHRRSCRDELRGIRTLLIIRATNTAVAFSLPVLSAVVAFVCYVGVGNELAPAKIFTAFSLFQVRSRPSLPAHCSGC